MRHRLFHASGLVIVAALTLSARPAAAQTVANGPYYATPSWDQQLPCSTAATCARFVVLANWNNEAVLDRETGLVWEQASGNRPGFIHTTNWGSAVADCREAATGGRLGWRLPTAQELASLIDPATKTLPSGNPFSFANGFYWTATTYAPIPSQAWTVRPGGFGASVFVPGDKSLAIPSLWCVRGGGPGLDAQ